MELPSIEPGVAVRMHCVSYATTFRRGWEMKTPADKTIQEEGAQWDESSPPKGATSNPNGA
jgi:hypothetical protein